jgi:hypothetical protein
MGTQKNVNYKIEETKFINDTSNDSLCNKFNKFYVSSVNDIVNSIESINNVDPVENLNEPKITFSSFSKVTLQETLNIIKEIKSSSAFDFIDKNIIIRTFETCGERLIDVINASILNGEFPDWKSNMIIPIPKITKPTEPQHFRPINILPFYEKIIEKIMYQQMIKFINDNDLLYENQSGFRKNYSCETALQLLFSNWREKLDKNEVIVSVMLDFKSL